MYYVCDKQKIITTSLSDLYYRTDKYVNVYVFTKSVSNFNLFIYSLLNFTYLIWATFNTKESYRATLFVLKTS